MGTPPAEIDIDAALVERLVTEQHPELLAPVTFMSSGWDNALFRLGDDWVVRMPRRAVAVALIENEQRWLPALQELVEVPIPVPVAAGVPSDHFPWPWTVARWLPGEPVAHLPIDARDGLVGPLAAFVRELHLPAPAGAPINPVRGTPLVTRNAAVRARLANGRIPDAPALLALWERALAAPAYHGPPLWMHGDLHPLNALAAPSGGLAAVLDFGDLGGADPACDLAAAWLFFDAGQRSRFRSEIGTAAPHDPGAWARAVGWGVAQATAFLADPTDAPALDAIGRHAVEQLVREL